jgi:hypothetical protein
MSCATCTVRWHYRRDFGAWGDNINKCEVEVRSRIYRDHKRKRFSTGYGHAPGMVTQPRTDTCYLWLYIATRAPRPSFRVMMLYEQTQISPISPENLESGVIPTPRPNLDRHQALPMCVRVAARPRRDKNSPLYMCSGGTLVPDFHLFSLHRESMLTSTEPLTVAELC